MRNKLLSILLTLLLPAVLLGTGLSLPRIYQDSYYAELAPMTERLEQAEGKRLILIGGSNIAFGIDGPLLEALLREKGFDYTVCPFGLYAAVGSSAMLSLCEDSLRAGDTAVLAFEPAADALSGYFGASAFLKCAESRPEMAFRLNGEQRTRVIGNLLPYLAEKAGICRSGVLPRAEGVYARSAFASTCTMVFDRPGNRMALGYDTVSPVDFDQAAASSAFVAQVNAFCRTAERRGAAVLMSFSPVNRSAVSGDIVGYFDRMNRTFTCPVISDPTRYVLDSGWFYDSNFHLNSAGQVLRTILLAEDLLAEWGCYAPLTCERPMMPEPVYAAAEAGAADSADFIAEPLEDPAFCCVTGLSEAGLEKRTLVIPSSVGGRMVADILPEAFDGAAAEELHIPGTVETLPDGLVLHCRNLQRLVLTHTAAPCGLRAHSLDGADNLQILVPAAVYSWYRDGYGCEENPWRPWLGQIFAY